MPATLDDAAKLLNTGDLVRAQAAIAQLLKQDMRNAQAWFLLAQCVTDPRQRKQCLERTLALDPHNQLARELLNLLKPAVLPIIEVPAPSRPSIEPPNEPLPPAQPIASLNLAPSPSISAPFQPHPFERTADLQPAPSQPFDPQPFQLVEVPSDSSTTPPIPKDSLPVWFRNPRP